jgi:tetratricopeptide (TPR) repeat protein
MRSLARIEKEHRLVLAVGRRFHFDHHQVHWALYHGLPLALREAYHATLGKAILAESGEPPEGAAAVRVCEQFLASEDRHAAREHLERALDHLLGGHLNAPALELADRALQVKGLLDGEDRARVLIRKAEILDITGRLEEQAEVLDEAIRLADSTGDARQGCRARQLRGNTLRLRGRTQRAIEIHEEASRLARESGDRRQEATVLGNLGSDYSDLGRFEEAREILERSLRMSREAGDRRSEGGCIGNMALILWEMGDFHGALDRLSECLAMFREVGYRRGEGMALGNMGLSYFLLGRYEEANRSYLEHLEISREIGYRRGQGLALGNLGLLSQTLGRYEDAWRYYQRQYEITREIGNPMHIAMCRQSLGHLLIELGDFEKARIELEESLAMIDEGQWVWGEATGHHMLAVLSDNEGNSELAEERYRRSLEIRERIGAREGVARARPRGVGGPLRGVPRTAAGRRAGAGARGAPDPRGSCRPADRHGGAVHALPRRTGSRRPRRGAPHPPRDPRPRPGGVPGVGGREPPHQSRDHPGLEGPERLLSAGRRWIRESVPS